MSIGFASIMALAGLVVGVIVLGVWLVAGWLGDAGGEPGSVGAIVFELGIRSDNDGRISVYVPACRPAEYLVVRVSERDGPTVWEAHADQPTPVDELVIGTAPVGFEDQVPFVGTLDPSTTYEIEFFVGYMDAPESPTLIGGAQASFEPTDLRPDRIWVGRRLVPPAEYQEITCAESDSA